MLSFDEALEGLLAAAAPVGEIRELPLEATAGRVLAMSQRALVAVPSLDNSAMDGYAVRVADIQAGTVLPISQRIAAGSVGTPLQAGTAARIFTGAPVPPGADAVVMQERCEAVEGGVSILQVPTPGENIRRVGEDMASGAEVLTAGTRLRPQELALAASAGLAKLPVYRRLRVAVFFTGDELRLPGEPLPPGAIYNSNRYALRALLEGLDCEVRDLGQVPDTLAATRQALRQVAGDNDLIITSGGVSVGEEDHVKPAVEAEGRLALWKIAIKPGKPLAFGEIDTVGKRTWFIGLPGNPVSSFLTFLMLARPFILKLQGVDRVLPQHYTVPADFDLKRTDWRTEFLRVRLNANGRVEAFVHQGSGVTTSLVWSDGLVRLPPETAVKRGDLLHFIPFSEVL